ncbi:MAG: hypothetical protein U0836_16195 [Pirellulales bacterium]
MSSFDDPNDREDVPFPAHGPVNVPDAFEMAAQAAQAQGMPLPAGLVPPVPMVPLRLGGAARAAAPGLSPINTPEQVLAVLSRLNPEKIRLAGQIFGRAAAPEAALLGILSRVDPPILTSLLGLSRDILLSLAPDGQRPPTDLLVNLELLGTVLTVMSRPQQNAQAVQAIGMLLG